MALKQGSLMGVDSGTESQQKAARSSKGNNQQHHHDGERPLMVKRHHNGRQQEATMAFDGGGCGGGTAHISREALYYVGKKRGRSPTLGGRFPPKGKKSIDLETVVILSLELLPGTDQDLETCSTIFHL